MTESEVSTNLPPLKGKELDTAYKAIVNGRGLDPATTNRFLHVDTEEHVGLSNADKFIPTALFAGYVATWAINHLGGTLPIPGVMPEQLDAILQAIHNIGSNAANSPTIRDHLPYLLLETSVAWGGLKTLPNFLNLNRKRDKIAKVQTETRQKIDTGDFPFKMSAGHTAAFVGRGDRTADLLQETKPADQVMLYSNVQIDSRVYQKMKDAGLQEELFRTFDKGDFKQAGEIVLFPIKDEDMFLPGEDGHDMSLDEIEAIIDLCDDYCDTRKISRKKVVIVGRETVRQSYTNRHGKTKAKNYTETLGQLVARLKTERGAATTEIFDPTRLVMEKIIDLASGKKIDFVATTESDQRYGVRFYQALEELGYKPIASESIQVRYNIQDTPTAVKANAGDITVILDPSRKQSLMRRKNIPEENILVVPEIVQKKLSTLVDKS